MGLETLVLPDHWKNRPDTWDLAMWDAVIVHDEYGLNNTQFDHADVCIDVGAHIGCFTWFAAEHGFGKIFAYEVEPSNYALLLNNVAPLGPVVETRHQPVWRSDRHETVHLRHCPELINTGGHTLVDGLDVSTTEITNAISFDDVIREAVAAAPSGRVKLVKMDCEGSEFPILYTATQLDLIDCIVGEYHERNDEPEHVAVGEYSIAALTRHLESEGFSVQHESRGDGVRYRLGFFRADR